MRRRCPRVLAELDGSGLVKTRFVYPDGAGAEEAPVAQLLRRLGLGSPTGYAQTTTPAYVIRGTQLLRVIADHLGSPRLLVDSVTGETVGRRDYDEWGRVTQDTLSAWLPQGFAGGLYDSDTGLVRFGARDYDAETGRWLSRDPVLFEGGQGNLYEYVGGDPINNTDATGEELNKQQACELAMATACAVACSRVKHPALMGICTGLCIGAGMASGECDPPKPRDPNPCAPRACCAPPKNGG